MTNAQHEHVIDLSEHAERSDFAIFVADNEIFETVRTAASGKFYVEAETGGCEVGKHVVRFVRVFDNSGGRRSLCKFVGFRKEAVGIIAGEGKSFLFRTKEAAILANLTPAEDVFHTRYYVEATE